MSRSVREANGFDTFENMIQERDGKQEGLWASMLLLYPLCSTDKMNVKVYVSGGEKAGC